MKFKKLLISASAIAAGSGLLATVLTSCAKANVDSKLKIDLNDDGLLYNQGNMSATSNKIDYKWAVTNALTRSNNWTQFKNALAEEIVFNWFTNRMATKGQDDKNTNFRTSYDEWEYQVNKAYNDTVQNCKNKYGANWAFYLQNEYLAPFGGSEASYKHAKLVEKVKSDFISKVFAKNYFGYRTETQQASLYPAIYTKATKSIDKNTLRNPDNWDRMGFFARAELSFEPTKVPTSYSEVDPNWLAKHPDGDYATIQGYVFDRWFKTEKPFFADAALFKYSNPKNVAGGKLDQIYDATRTEVKIPTDKPSEAFPFFGAGKESGTAKAVNFIQDLINGNFATKYTTTEGAKITGTITIPVADTDDSQTCLLVCGNQMFSSLYTPYAMACGALYSKMMGLTGAADSENKLAAATVRDNIWKDYTGIVDDFRLLSNFFYAANPSSLGITKFLDLQTIYGGLSEYESKKYEYHCPLFANCPTYKHFYGDAITHENGIRYISNYVQVDDFDKITTTAGLTPEQPWVMELNEAGIHILTIDGYAATTAASDKLAQQKKNVMFRLMQKQINDNAAACISTDLLGESGKLKTYFNDNFANIVLEMAMTGKDEDTNVFRTIESYAKDHGTSREDKVLFLYNICMDQALTQKYDALMAYIKDIISFEDEKKCVSSLETANNKIYSYRSKQITNSKNTEQFSKTVFENGLLAPFAYRSKTVGASTIDSCMHDFASVNRVVLQNFPTASWDTPWTRIKTLITKIETPGTTTETNAFLKDVQDNMSVNGSTGFCPQIKAAKASGTNRFWYRSALIDKLMYSYMGNKSNTVNGIKMNAYNYYVSQKDKNNEWFGDSGRLSKDCAKHALSTTYYKNKVLTADKNLAAYAAAATDVANASSFYTLMDNSYAALKNKALIENGITADECANFDLWKATLMYLISGEKDGDDPFTNFYTILNSKIGDDESALVGYMTKGYTFNNSLSETALENIGTTEPTTPFDYKFNADVDNMFDKLHYEGGETVIGGETVADSKSSTTSHWNVVQRKFSDTKSYDLSGFLGLQTKGSNQLDSSSGLQSAVFDNFAKATDKTWDVTGSSTAAYASNTGCWFKFAGSKDSEGEVLKIADFTYTEGEETFTFKADEWFPKEKVEGVDYTIVRKVAKKIREYATPDDLRTLAKTLADSYDGYSYFSAIADGSEVCKNVDEMRMKMFKLLPSPKTAGDEKAHKIQAFQRVKNVEARTVDNNPSIVFKDTKGKTSYKLLMTQINKADAVEKTLAPTWNDKTSAWEQKDSPITPEEFFIILYNMASEATVQQRAITEIVKTAFGDKKLIVYDAQLYNQFDSVWIKDWTKKTMGA